MKPKTVGRADGINFVTSATESAGLLADSIILTPEGDARVGELEPGQRVITRDNGIARIRALHRHEVVSRAVRIMAGSLGDTRPDHDVTLPAGQGVFIRDWRAQALYGTPQAMVPASRLIDGEFIRSLGQIRMRLIEIEFDYPHILYVDGLEVAGHCAATTTAIAA